MSLNLRCQALNIAFLCCRARILYFCHFIVFNVFLLYNLNWRYVFKMRPVGRFLMLKMIKKNKNYGLSLLELMIALLLINIVFFSFIAVVALILKSAKQGEQVSKGAIVANSIMEEFIDDNRMQLPLKTTKGTKKFGDIDYNYEITVDRMTPATIKGDGLYYIDITVSHKELDNSREGKNSGSNQVNLYTIIFGCATKGNS